MKRKGYKPSFPRPSSRVLEIKWGTSKGAETYGYTTCAAYLDGVRLGACNGGGYDMAGTVVANMLEAEYPDRLLALADRAHGHYRQRLTDNPRDPNDPKWDRWGVPERKDAFYGSTAYHDTDGKPIRVGIDGACGLSSVEQIAKAIGLRLRYVSRNSKHTIYALEDSTPDAA